jgi:hypothetical protein
MYSSEHEASNSVREQDFLSEKRGATAADRGKT